MHLSPKGLKPSGEGTSFFIILQPSKYSGATYICIIYIWAGATYTSVRLIVQKITQNLKSLKL